MDYKLGKSMLNGGYWAYTRYGDRAHFVMGAKIALCGSMLY